MTDTEWEAFRRVYWDTQHPNMVTEGRIREAYDAAVKANTDRRNMVRTQHE